MQVLSDNSCAAPLTSSSFRGGSLPQCRKLYCHPKGKTPTPKPNQDFDLFLEAVPTASEDKQGEWRRWATFKLSVVNHVDPEKTTHSETLRQSSLNDLSERHAGQLPLNLLGCSALHSNDLSIFGEQISAQAR